MKETVMNFLIFSDDDLPITKGLRRISNVVTAWPAGKNSADILYNPEASDLKSIFARLPNSFCPDAVICTNLDYITFLWGFHEVEVPVIATISNSNLCFDVFQSALPFIDLFICNDESAALRLRGIGAEASYLPWHGVDTEVFRPQPDRPIWDVVFLGNLNPVIHRRRGKLLEKILSVPERIEARVIPELSSREVALALSRAQIVFNHSGRGEIDQRVCEALGVGRLLLIEDSNNEVVRYFKDRRDLILYNDENLLDTIEYYLQHPIERDAIARTGREEALRRHTGLHKAEAIITIISEFLQSRKPKRKSVEQDQLHRCAGRIFMHHGRKAQALWHSSEALRLNDTFENRISHARFLGTLSFFEKRHLSDFQRATEDVLNQNSRAAWTRWNHIELEHFLGEISPEVVRGFIFDLIDNKLESEPFGGPLPISYDAFRVAWDSTLTGQFATKELQKIAQQRVLLSRAYEVLGDSACRQGRRTAALEAYGEALKISDDGIVAHKLGSLQAKVGRFDEARKTLLDAINSEPFFFAARRDLAALELNSGAGELACKMAKSALLQITLPFKSFESSFLEVLDYAAIPSTHETYTLGSSLHWEGDFLKTPSCARNAILLIDELLRVGLPIIIQSHKISRQSLTIDPETLRRLEDSSRRIFEGSFVRVIHLPSNTIKRRAGALGTVCRMTYELQHLPQDLREILGIFDQVWVESEFAKQLLLKDGVSPQCLSVIPNPIGEFPPIPPEPLEFIQNKQYIFLSVFEWGPRNGWDILIRAYLTEFTKEDDVALILRVYPVNGKPETEIRDEVRAFIRNELRLDPEKTPEILFIDEVLSQGEMRSLYASAQAFVLPTRGEGFGAAYLEAILAGLPTIATRWGGQLDFLNDQNSYLLDIEGMEAVPAQVAMYRGSLWANPSVDHLRALLRRVYEDPEEGHRKARRGAAEILFRYNVRNVGNLAIRELNRLKEGSKHGR